MEAIWNWLNGNKTLFGLIILDIAQHVDPSLLLFGFIPVQAALNWVGGVLAGVGAIHKMAKANTDPGPNS